MLASFFQHFNNETWDTLARYATAIQLPVLMQEKVNFLLNRSIAGKLRKNNWQPQACNWDEAVAQL